MNMKLILMGTATIVGLAAFAAAAARGRIDFPGGDAGIQQASDSGRGEQVAGRVLAAGIEIEVTGILADSNHTVLAVAIRGREDLGQLAAPAGRPVLVAASGMQYEARHLSPSDSDPRLQTWTFPPLAEASQTLTLKIDAIEIWTRPSAVDAASAPPPIVTRLTAQWDVTFTWTGEVAQSNAPVALTGAQSTFGPGRVVVETTSRADSGLVLAGRLEGFTADQIAEVVLWPAYLVMADGTRLLALSGRSGFGPNREHFEFRFPSIPPGVVTLSIPLNLSTGTSPNADARASVAPFAGSRAEIQLTVVE